MSLALNNWAQHNSRNLYKPFVLLWIWLKKMLKRFVGFSCPLPVLKKSEGTWYSAFHGVWCIVTIITLAQKVNNNIKIYKELLTFCAKVTSSAPSDSMYLVSVTLLHFYADYFFLNCTDVCVMVWRYACDLDRIFRLIFIIFSAFWT